MKQANAEIVTENQMAVATRPSQALSQPSIADLEAAFALAVRQRELLSEYIKSKLQPGKHFYKREGEKPSLTKEGAEIILLPHGLAPDYELVSGPAAPPANEGESYQITVKCVLRKKGVPASFEGSAIGSAGSMKWSKKHGYQPRQRDRFLCHNATLKMAEKSAMIAAVLNSTAASEFFTQDMEPGEGDPEDEDPRTPPPSQPASPSRPASAPAFPTHATLDFFVVQAEKKLKDFVEKPREAINRYAEAVGKLMPNEDIASLPLHWCPVSGEQIRALVENIKDFCQSGSSPKPWPFDAHKEEAKPKPIEVPREQEPWRSFPIPFGKQAGKKMGDVDRKYLFGLWANFKAEETWVGEDGKEHKVKPDKLAKDRKFREMLDQAGLALEFSKPEEER